jgi:hypothetical protein
MADTNLPIEPVGGALLDTGTDAKLGGETRDFGMALGDLVKHVGIAVAQAQQQLNATSAGTASKLAETTIKVVAVRERYYDEDGNPTTHPTTNKHVNNHHMELPLVNFVDPVFYQWNRVRVEGQFQAYEWKGNTTSDTDSTRYGGSVSLFVGAPMGNGAGDLLRAVGQGGSTAAQVVNALGGNRAGGSLYYNNTSVGVETNDAYDTSYGQMRMNAELSPVPGIGVPKPTQVFISPRIGILPADKQPITGGRTIQLLIEYVRPVSEKDREANEANKTKTYLPIAGKSIAFEAPGLEWAYSDPTKTQTDSDGRVGIKLTRMFPKADPNNPDSPLDTSDKGFVVSAYVGMVRSDVTVVF